MERIQEVSRLASYLDGEHRLPYVSYLEDANNRPKDGEWRDAGGHPMSGIELSDLLSPQRAPYE
jgi:hypothetical protein